MITSIITAIINDNEMMTKAVTNFKDYGFGILYYCNKHIRYIPEDDFTSLDLDIAEILEYITYKEKCFIILCNIESKI